MGADDDDVAGSTPPGNRHLDVADVDTRHHKGMAAHGVAVRGQFGFDVIRRMGE